MSIQRVLALSRKECIHLVRNWRSLVMAILIPMLLLILFGYALTLDVDQVPIVIWDQNKTPTSRDLISRFAASHYFTLVQEVEDYPALNRMIDNRAALAGLVIPHDYAKRIDRLEPVGIQL